MQFWNNPFFWAFLSTIGCSSGFIIVSSKIFGKNTIFGVFVVALVELPRIILPLPFINQPRFADITLLPIIGFIVLIIALVFGIPAFLIKPFTRPQKEEKLRKTGLYSVVRHPIYFCDIFWPLGLSLIFRSLIGTALTVVWFIIFYLLTFLEEEKLIEEYGDEYLKYKQKVPRIIPFLKFL
jgi:protein-S-isoprenylcysteine O-methyltransferase Ste14